MNYNGSISKYDLNKIENELSKNKSKEAILSFRDRKKVPRFNMYSLEPNGVDMDNKAALRDRIKSFDSAQELMNFNANEKFVFLVLRDSYQYDHKEEREIRAIRVEKKNLTPRDYSKFRNGIASLNKKGITKRISKYTYMISPNFLIPVNYEHFAEIYLDLKKEYRYITLYSEPNYQPKDNYDKEVSYINQIDIS